MAIQNQYNPNPVTTDSILKERQNRIDLLRSQGENIPTQEYVSPENPRVLGVEQTPDYAGKSFGRKVFEDAALLTYAIPVGLAKTATGLVTNPVDTIKTIGSGFVQSAKDLVDIDYYKAHPLLGIVNLAGFIQPVAGIAKSLALGTATKIALRTALAEGVANGVKESLISDALSIGSIKIAGANLKKGALEVAVEQAAKIGNPSIVAEVVKNALSKAGISEDISYNIGVKVAGNVTETLARQSSKMKVLDSIIHPVGSAYSTVAEKIDPLRKAIFGEGGKSAVSLLYGAETVAKNPEDFLGIERWAESQVKERGFDNTVANRQRIMNEWVENNSQWASLTPEQRISHFKNYAEQDLIRRSIHEATGKSIVTTKALPQHYVDAMVGTINDAPAEMGIDSVIKLLEDNYGNDFKINSAEIIDAVKRNGGTREALASAVSKLGNSRSEISFSRYSPEVQKMVDELEKSGYRIGLPPKDKKLSFVSDVFNKSDNQLTSPDNQLINEARKYKSAEDFASNYKNNPKIQAIVHAGETPETVKIKDLFLSEDAGTAKLGFGKGIEAKNLTAGRSINEPVLVLGKNTVIDGHTRIQQAIANGEDAIKIYRVKPASEVKSQLTDIWKKANNESKVEPISDIGSSDILAKRTLIGNWIDKLGLSPTGQIEGASEFAFREKFTQSAMSELATKYGDVLKAGKIHVPVEKLFEWIQANIPNIEKSRPSITLTNIRTVFDVKAQDLIRAGFSPEVAQSIESLSKKSLRDVPTSIVGLGDKVINYMRTSDSGFGSWMSSWYDKYLKIAYKGRYDWSPFFSAQQFVETKIQSAMLLKDIGQIPGASKIAKLGNWTAEKLGIKLQETVPYLKNIVAEPPLSEVAMVREEILGSLQQTMLDYTSSPDTIAITNAAKGGYELLKDKAAFETSIRSRNLWYAITGQSTVRMATTFNRALAEKFGMSLDDALKYTIGESGQKVYKNPQMVQTMRETTQALFHYKPGLLTSPLMKTLNIAFFPLRFQTKTAQMTAQWLGTLSPASRLVVMNNFVNFANWVQTPEGEKWRITNRNYLYNIFTYATAYEQMGQSIQAVSKGRLFGGNTGLIGGVPFGFAVNLARELAIIPSDPDEFDPKTGKRFQKTTPKNIVSAAGLSVALEQLLISILPSTPFYSLTGGAIQGISPTKVVQSLVRQTVGGINESIKGRDSDKGLQKINKQFKKVPLDYSRINK